jgi:hypothetical protein
MSELDDFLTPTLDRQLEAEKALCTATQNLGWRCGQPKSQ